VLRDLPIRGALGVLGAGICHVLQVADRLRGAASLARTQVSTCSQLGRSTSQAKVRARPWDGLTMAAWWW
jgi:hypothetical protein